MNAKSNDRTYAATMAGGLARRKFTKIVAAITVLAAVLGWPSGLLAAEVTTDQMDYLPGATAWITGSGFTPGETVVLQVLHADGTESSGADHDPWSVIADTEGAITTSWHVCEDDCLGSTLQLTAAGQTSGQFAETFFTDAVFAVRLITVTSPVGACVRVVSTQSTFQVFLRVGLLYRMTASLVTNGVAPPCLVSNPPTLRLTLGTNFGSTNITLLRLGGPASTTYSNFFVMPATACGDTTLNFVCDDGSTQALLAPLPSTAPVRLVASLNCLAPITCSGGGQPPTINCPFAVLTNTAPGECSVVVFYPPPSATGNPAPTVTCSPPAGSTFPVGDTLVNCTASNSAGSASCVILVNVRDNQRPSISCPANVTVPTAPGKCSATVLYAVGASDNCPGVTVTCAPPSGTNFALGSTTVFCTARDRFTNAASCSFVVTVTNAAPVITAVTGPSGPVALGSSASVTVDFADADIQQTHTCLFEWDDGTSDIVSLGAGIGTATQTHTYAAAGVYTVTVTVSDPCTNASQELQFIVIFDPNGGFVTGGGWIQSSAGAYSANPELTGRANFGFVSKYHNGASVPTGQTEFHFEVGELNFHSTDYQWLVVAGPLAQYKGTGTVNGAGSYSFLLTARDGQANGGGGIDKFRIKIWNADEVIYDNVLGASDDIDGANPQAVEGGNIVVHR